MQTIDGQIMSGTVIYTSRDRGQTFSLSTLAPAQGHQSSYQGNGLVLSDGTFIAPFAELDSKGSKDGFLRVIRSEDGGNTFSTAITVSKWVGPFSPMSLAVDQTAGVFRDRIYAVWADSSSGRSQLMLSYSSDKGKTWSNPVAVNDDEPFSDGRKGPDDFMGVVAVNRAGVVGVSWYDRRDSANNRDWWVRFAASCDGGKSFLPSIKVSESAFTHEPTKARPIDFSSAGGGDYESPYNTLGLQVHPTRAYYGGGDTAGLAADADGIFHGLWIDNRTGFAQVWTAPITVNESAACNNGHKFQGLDDITEKLILGFNDTHYDEQTKTMSAAAYLINTSAETLVGPIIVRMLRLVPQTAEVLNADNHQTGKGATWEYTALLKHNMLEPGNRTAGRLIQFRILDKAAQEAPPEPTTVLAMLQVFGRLKPPPLQR
jgi:hypothetical protein